jgi:uncharacterized protein
LGGLQIRNNGWDVRMGQNVQDGVDAALRGDVATALRIWTPLAEQGAPDAQINLGQLFYNQQDYANAVKWYTQAADQGVADAAFKLGQMYNAGQGVPQYFPSARRFYTIAAELGHADAQVSLGLMHSLGKGGPLDNVKAYMWARIAAYSGNRTGKKMKGPLSRQMNRSQLKEATKKFREFVAKTPKG